MQITMGKVDGEAYGQDLKDLNSSSSQTIHPKPNNIQGPANTMFIFEIYERNLDSTYNIKRFFVCIVASMPW